jgi:hypothetical protein
MKLKLPIVAKQDVSSVIDFLRVADHAGAISFLQSQYCCSYDIAMELMEEIRVEASYEPRDDQD